MGAGKNKSHRKKRISKHVLQAEERRKQAEVENKLLSAASGGGASSSSSEPPPPSSAEPAAAAAATPPPSKTKDPEEASSYLTLWDYDRKNATKQWKFNKNTQSWLLRHMYDFDKVSKATFGLLVDYLCGGGEGTMGRVDEDAKRRARRYKEWDKSQQQQDGGGEDEEGKEGGASTKKDKQSSSASGTADDKSWMEMDDHDKRKEYKRARKVLDAIKAARDGKGKAEEQ